MDNILEPRDLSVFINGSTCARQEFGASLVDDYTRTGFARIVGHGFTHEQVRLLFEMSKSFFRLPEAVKNSIAHHPGPYPQRGWSAIGAEKSANLFNDEFGDKLTVKDRLDCREHFDMGMPGDEEFQNKWLGEEHLPNFRAHLEQTFEHLARVSTSLLEALECGFQVPPGSFTSRVSNTASEFRLLHYPAVSLETLRAGKVQRIWPHFDLGVITLLFQDGAGGLEIEDRGKANSFVPIMPSGPAEMITNSSETIQRLTNGKLPAGLHQVTIPPGMKQAVSGMVSDRYSIAFFCKADRDTSVGPLRPFVSESHPALYEEMTAIEYQQKRLAAAY